MQRDNNEENVRPPVAAFDDILIGGDEDITDEHILIMSRQADIQRKNDEALAAALMASLGNQASQSDQTQHAGLENKDRRESIDFSDDVDLEQALQLSRDMAKEAADLALAIAASEQQGVQVQTPAPSVRMVFSAPNVHARTPATSSTSFAAAPTPAVERKGESEAARIARETRVAAAFERLANAAKTAGNKPGTSSNSVQSAVGTQASTSTTTTTTTTATVAIRKTPKK